MTEALRVAEARRISCEKLDYLEVVLVNDATLTVGPGGLRMVAARSHDGPIAMSLSNSWPIRPGASVFLTAILPRDGLKHVDFVDYIGFDGTVHTLGDRLSIGWFFSGLKRGTIGADVQA